MRQDKLSIPCQITILSQHSKQVVPKSNYIGSNIVFFSNTTLGQSALSLVPIERIFLGRSYADHETQNEI